ncbi:MarR family winged helix-turn-helix transcriptional regulator [Brachybacterium sp. DNPG3]
MATMDSPQTDPTAASTSEPPAEPRWLSEEERRAWMATTALITLLPAELDARLRARSDLTFFEYMVLSVLSEQVERTMQMSELARLSSSSLSRLSHVAGRLEKRGLLERRRSPGVGRRTMATLTDAGFAVVVAAAPGHAGDVRELLMDRLQGEQVAALRAIGQTVIGAIDADLACAIAAFVPASDAASSAGPAGPSGPADHK